ncbi:hypothetical protein ACTXT7_010820 [Hymenolepis weldensis]
MGFVVRIKLVSPKKVGEKRAEQVHGGNRAVEVGPRLKDIGESSLEFRGKHMDMDVGKMWFWAYIRSTAGDIFRRLSLLPQCSAEDIPKRASESPTEDSSGCRSDPVWSSSDNNTSNSEDSSSALVRACFIGLALVHFAVAFWTRTWIFRFVLLVLTIGALALIVSYMQLIPIVLWILKVGLEYIKNAIHPAAPSEVAPEQTDAGSNGGSDAVFNESNEKEAIDRRFNEDYDNSTRGENEEEESILNLILPNHLKRSLRRICKIERHLYDFVDDYLDYLVSLVIISMMVLITLLFPIFLIVQVYGETLNLISLSSSVLNSAVQSGAFSWLPDKDQLGSAARSAVSNVHQFGRTFIKSKVDELFHGNLSNKSNIEEQLLELWERVFMQFFQESNGTEALVPQQAVKSSFILTGELAGSLNNATQNISLGVLKKRIVHLFFSLGGFDYHDLDLQLINLVIGDNLRLDVSVTVRQVGGHEINAHRSKPSYVASDSTG